MACSPTPYLPVKDLGNIRFSGETSCSPASLTQMIVKGERQATIGWAEQGHNTWTFNNASWSGVKNTLTGCFHPNSTYRTRVTASVIGFVRPIPGMLSAWRRSL